MRFSNKGSIASGVTSRPVKPGPAGGDDHVNRRIGDPAVRHRADRFDVVGDDLARGKPVSRIRDAPGEGRAGAVLLEGARVRYRQHGYVEGNEGAAVIDAMHGCAVTLLAWRWRAQ